MAFKSRGKFKGKGKGNGNNGRLTGLFKTKRKGLYVGTCQDESFSALVKIVKAAKEADKGVTFFLWVNDEGKAKFTLKANVAQDRPESDDKEIEEDDDSESEESSDDSDDDF